MKKLFTITIVLALLLITLASCNNIDKLVSYEDVRKFLLYDHIIYNGTPYYITENSPDLSEDGRLVYETFCDVIIVDKNSNPYDAERKEEAWIFPDTDPEIIYIYFNSAYYTRDTSLVASHYKFEE